MQTMFKDGSVLIEGGISKDVELKLVGDEKKANVKFGVAVGKRDDATIWVNCEAWHDLARACSALKKGDHVMCVGTIKTHEYEGKTYKTLVCDSVFPSFACMRTSTPAETPAPAATLDSLDGFEEVLNNGDVPF